LRIEQLRFPGDLDEDYAASMAAEQIVRRWMTFRPAEEQSALTVLANNLAPASPRSYSPD
jgi:hypothetical protein